MQKHPVLIALGHTIRALRQAHGFSQEAFANEVGLDRSYYGGIERGERNVATLNLVLLAEKLGVEVGELFPPIKSLTGAKSAARKKAR